MTVTVIALIQWVSPYMYHTQMVQFQKGDVIRIISPDTEETGSLVPIPYTMNIMGDWDPNTLTLSTEESIVYEAAPMTYHRAVYVGEDDLELTDSAINYLNDAMLDDIVNKLGIDYDLTLYTIEEDTYPILPVVGRYHTPEVRDPLTIGMGIILVDVIAYPMPRKKSHIGEAPLNIPGELMDMLWDRMGGGYDDLDDWLVRLYDFGYEFPSHIRVNQPTLYRLIQNEGLIYRLLPLLDPNALITTTITSMKKEANALLSNGEDDSPYNRLFQICPDHMSWFFTPSGWYHYGYQSRYSWVVTRDTIHIPILPEIADTILSMLTVIPSNIEGTSHQYIDYDVPDRIKEVLSIMNKDMVRVLLSGDTTKDRYDYYVLGGDPGIVRELLAMLPPGDHRATLDTSLHTVMDVLYSHSMSSSMIAHDGTQFYLTPEFMTFTSAGLSLMVLPTAIKRQMDSYRVVYPHASFSTEHPLPATRTWLSMVAGSIRHIRASRNRYVTDVRYGRDIDMIMDDFHLYMDDNGTSYGYRPLDPDTLYYIRYIEGISTNRLILAREVLPTLLHG